MRLGKFKVPVWAILLVVLIVFLLVWYLVDTAKGNEHNLFLEIVGRLSEAVVIASILGITIDAFLKSAIVKDAFEAALGYLLPDELKPEMEWIYAQNIICEMHNQKYDLIRRADYVIMEAFYERTFRNFTNRTQTIKPAIAIDEWFHQTERSAITEIGYIHDKKRTILTPGAGLEIVNREYGLFSKEFEIQLKAGERITVWSRFREVKQINDATYMVFNCPTKNPRIEVNADDSLGIHFGFAHRAEWEDLSKGTEDHRLKAVGSFPSKDG